MSKSYFYLIVIRLLPFINSSGKNENSIALIAKLLIFFHLIVIISKYDISEVNKNLFWQDNQMACHLSITVRKYYFNDHHYIHLFSPSQSSLNRSTS